MAAITITKVSETLIENRWSAEFFEPQYLFKPKHNYKWVRIGRILKQCQYGISISMNEESKGYPIFRMNEIENCFTTNAVKYAAISEKEFKHFELNYDDVIFNRTNSIDFVGRTGIFKGGTPSAFASYLVRVKTDRNAMLPEFLTIYLNTKFGKGQIRRRAMHSINQANVSAAELKRILIPLIEIEKQEVVAELVNRAFNLKKTSIDLYAQATKLLEDALGLDKIEFTIKKSYTATFSEVVSMGRVDSEFHNVKYNSLLDKINAYHFGCVQLNKMCERVLPKFDRTNEKSKEIIYIEIGDINISDGDFEFKEIVTEEAPANAKIALNGGEVLVSMVRPTRGAIAIIPDDLPDKVVVCSGAFYVFNPKDLEKREIIWLYLRVVRNCFEKYCGGTSYPTIEPRYLSSFPIPNFPSDLAKQISTLICEGVSAKKLSKQLLEQAIQEVESLIEQSTTEA